MKNSTMKNVLRFVLLSGSLACLACGGADAIGDKDGSTDGTTPTDGSGGGETGSDAGGDSGNPMDAGNCLEAGAPNMQCANVSCNKETQYCQGFLWLSGAFRTCSSHTYL